MILMGIVAIMIERLTNYRLPFSLCSSIERNGRYDGRYGSVYIAGLLGFGITST